MNFVFISLMKALALAETSVTNYQESAQTFSMTLMISPDYTSSIYKHINSMNDADALTLATDFEQKSIALVRYKKHLTFNRRGVLPPSLSFTPPIRTKVRKKIARKAGLKYLRLPITNCHNNIKALTTTLHELTVKLESKQSRKHLRALQETVKQ